MLHLRRFLNKLKFKSKSWITSGIQKPISVKNELLSKFIKLKDTNLKSEHHSKHKNYKNLLPTSSKRSKHPTQCFAYKEHYIIKTDQRFVTHLDRYEDWYDQQIYHYLINSQHLVEELGLLNLPNAYRDIPEAWVQITRYDCSASQFKDTGL